MPQHDKTKCHVITFCNWATASEIIDSNQTLHCRNLADSFLIATGCYYHMLLLLLHWHVSPWTTLQTAVKQPQMFLQQSTCHCLSRHIWSPDKPNEREGEGPWKMKKSGQVQIQWRITGNHWPGQPLPSLHHEPGKAVGTFKNREFEKERKEWRRGVHGSLLKHLRANPGEASFLPSENGAEKDLANPMIRRCRHLHNSSGLANAGSSWLTRCGKHSWSLTGFLRCIYIYIYIHVFTHVYNFTQQWKVRC